MKSITLLPVVLALVTVACSKPSPEEQKKKEDELAAALGSALRAPSAAPSGSAAPAAAGAPGTVTATCNNKGDGKCTEVMGAEGLGADDSCKRLGGVYTKGATPCPRENVIGTCARTDKESSLNDLDYFYKSGGVEAANMKSLCEGVMSGVWAAPSGAPAAKAAAAAPAAKPSAKAAAAAPAAKAAASAAKGK